MKRKPIYYIRHADRYLARLVRGFLPPHKPAFMIIGAQKAATTSLYNYLNQLPGLSGSTNKEIYFFDREMNHNHDLDWYHGHFRGMSNSLYFEATPNYLYYPWVAERLHAYNPNLKLIVVLREPISRAYSAWNMYRDFFQGKETYRLRKGLEPGEPNYIYHHLFKNRVEFPSFAECLKIETEIMKKGDPEPEPALKRRGLYADQIENYLRFFPREQLMIIGYKDLITNPVYTVSRIHTFLTGKSNEKIQFKADKRNARRYSNAVSPEIREELTAFYASSNARLKEILGTDINW